MRLILSLPMVPIAMLPLEAGTGGFGPATAWACKAYSSRLVITGAAIAVATDFLKKLLRVVLFINKDSMRGRILTRYCRSWQ
jgi:hypothetical protein